MIKAHYPPYAITRLLIVVTLLMSATFAADAERVDYQRAAKIAQKYITLRNNKSIKAQAVGKVGNAERALSKDTLYSVCPLTQKGAG